ncbi:MAG: hypothetical protein ACR2IE_10970 [Candidatus Sumerlaeaceae bacterium]
MLESGAFLASYNSGSDWDGGALGAMMIAVLIAAFGAVFALTFAVSFAGGFVARRLHPPPGVPSLARLATACIGAGLLLWTPIMILVLQHAYDYLTFWGYAFIGCLPASALAALLHSIILKWRNARPAAA